jgi:hypothetical protein
MAATVDSTGSANVNERVVLTIPQKTSGEAKQTSVVSLGLNFPADAQTISEKFNRANPATYNKSTAFTVYDNGGNGYLATIYYVKTANANQNVPFNKWQTHVFVGEDAVEASLVQATNSNNEKLYVNQYGQIKPYSDVKDELTTAKTQLFSLDELTDKRTSTPAVLTGTTVAASALFSSTGVNFSATPLATADLTKVFSVSIDGSTAVDIDLTHLKTRTTPLTGSELAAEVTNVLNRKFGDQSTFNFSDASSRKFTISSSKVPGTGTPTAVPIELWPTTVPANPTIEDTLTEIQAKLDASAINTGQTNKMRVSYDYDTQSFAFVDGTSTITIKSTDVKNDVLGLTSTSVTLDEKGLYGAKAIPNGNAIVATAEQRYGMKVNFDSVNKIFNIQSGTTGDKSAIQISFGGTTDAIKAANANLSLGLFGFKADSIETSKLATRGINSEPAIAYGSTPTINMANNFAVDSSNNTFVVTVNGIKGKVVLPINSNYSLSSFKAALEKGINSLSSSNGTLTPSTVNGVKVDFDVLSNRFTFKTGTTGSDSFIKISGSSNWGLETVEAGRGTTSSWINPT